MKLLSPIGVILIKNHFDLRYLAKLVLFDRIKNSQFKKNGFIFRNK